LLIALLQICKQDSSRFLIHKVNDSLGVVYPQYWLQCDGEKNIRKHLDMITATFLPSKKLGNSDAWVLEVLSTTSRDIQ
jgi:hypothetical protein